MIKVNFKRRQMIYDLSETVVLFVLCEKIVPDETAQFPQITNDVLYIGSLSNVKSMQRINKY